jgi:hypothetical protein
LIRPKSEFLGVNVISDGIEGLDFNAIANQTVDPDTLSLALGSFVIANEELVKILRRRESLPLEQRTPPNQTTIPADPKFSGESTDSSNSWSSSDSNPEHFTHLFAYQFINASLVAVRKYFGKIPWLEEKCNTIIHTFSTCLVA